MQAHPITVFPLLQSVVSVTAAGVSADMATMTGGATLAFDSTGDIANDSYEININNPALGITNVLLGYDWCGLCAQVGSRSVDVRITDPAASNLSWTTYGQWVVHEHFAAPATTYAAFVTGYKTPSGSVPTTGLATYNGSVAGRVFYAQAGHTNGVGISGLSGSVTLQANFSNGAITGSLTNMMAGSLPWNSVSLLGAISGGQFTGSSAATSAPGNITSLNASATGTFAGMFFGPGAQEAGAVWTLYDGTKAAVGSFGASTATDGCAGCWDY